MRQRHKAWEDNFLQEQTDLIISNPRDNKGKWQAHFANNNPIQLEIGTGKGQFISRMAAKYPDVNFIGIDQGSSIIAMAGYKVKQSGCDNVALILDNADSLTEIFAENEVSTIYLNFSDPWPKKRHTKRRLTYYTYLEQYKHLLQTEGEIILKTDDQNLFEYSLVNFSQYGFLLNEINLDLHRIQDPENITTEYEDRFSARGEPIYRCKVSLLR